MNKKLTPLEALNYIKENFLSYEIPKDSPNCVKELNIIETALKDYELLKERTKLDSFECLLRLEEILPRGKELLVPVAKQIKALEIIKNLPQEEKQVLLNAVYTYTKSEEDYDLLKEIL